MVNGEMLLQHLTRCQGQVGHRIKSLADFSTTIRAPVARRLVAMGNKKLLQLRRLKFF